MIIHDVLQGTDEWFQARLGVPTASEFDKIITTERKASKQAEGYMRKLLAEMVVGKPLESFKSEWMERGNELEDDAALFYELQNDLAVSVVGFCTDEEYKYGCSPDRLVGEEGLLEIKCPAPQTMIEYYLKGTLSKDYKQQIQGQLFITGRKWCDILAYHPEMPPVLQRVERDEAFIEALRIQLEAFHGRMIVAVRDLKTRGYIVSDKYGL